MKKPGVISFFGGMFFVWLVLAMLPWIGAAFHIPSLAFWAVAWFAVWPACLSGVVWVIGSALCWAIERNGRQQAAAIAAAMAGQVRAPRPPVPPPAPQPAPSPAAAASGSCAACGQPAASLYCTVHRAPLCPSCAAAHVKASAGPVACLLAGVPVAAAPPRPRPLMTSPLGLS